jgi:hypothetical protein
MGSSIPRVQRISRHHVDALVHLAIALWATAVLPLSVPYPVGAADPSRPASVRLEARWSPHGAGEDPDAESDTSQFRWRRSRLGKEGTAPPGGYDAKRIKRFWKHYHGAEPEPKAKRLEHSK